VIEVVLVANGYPEACEFIGQAHRRELVEIPIERGGANNP
jgi:hypothetical protein